MALNHVEIMAPVGSYESLMAAIQGGANSVYFGIEKMNMRAHSSNNFTYLFVQNGIYIINLTVTDNDGSINTYNIGPYPYSLLDGEMASITVKKLKDEYDPFGDFGSQYFLPQHAVKLLKDNH